MCRNRLSSPRCRSELIDSAWVVIVPGQKCTKKPPKKTFRECGSLGKSKKDGERLVLLDNSGTLPCLMFDEIHCAAQGGYKFL